MILLFGPDVKICTDLPIFLGSKYVFSPCQTLTYWCKVIFICHVTASLWIPPSISVLTFFFHYPAELFPSEQIRLSLQGRVPSCLWQSDQPDPILFSSIYQRQPKPRTAQTTGPQVILDISACKVGKKTVEQVVHRGLKKHTQGLFSYTVDTPSWDCNSHHMDVHLNKVREGNDSRLRICG